MLEDSEKQRVLDLANELDVAFDWSQTPQGHDYWEEVFKNLNRLGGATEEDIDG